MTFQTFTGREYLKIDAAIQWVIASCSFAFPHDLVFSARLQAVHDNARTAEEHERGLRALALTNGLSIPE